jgi:hypothetical protein
MARQVDRTRDVFGYDQRKGTDRLTVPKVTAEDLAILAEPDPMGKGAAHLCSLGSSPWREPHLYTELSPCAFGLKILHGCG